jgi:hypothetical protein
VRLPTLCLWAAAALASLIAPQTASAGDVYFLQGEQLVAVERPGSTIAEAVAALVEGPTADEAGEGLRTYVPAETPVREVAFADGVATVDLGEAFAAGRNSEVLGARIAQLVFTVSGVADVESVRVLVSGGVPLGLFPGVDLTAPVTTEDVLRPDVKPPPPPVPEPGVESEASRQLQQRLADLGYLPPAAVDGVFGDQTRFAVVAFQKWEGLDRDGVPGPATQAALEQASRPTPQSSGGGRRTELLLDRQLLLLVEGGRVTRTISVSSGAPGYDTPPGSYSVFRKEEMSWSVPFQVWLPWASYFVGGIAFHEYPDVPPYPASHGCVRVPRYDAELVYRFTPIGTPVTVLTTSR